MNESRHTNTGSSQQSDDAMLQHTVATQCCNTSLRLVSIFLGKLKLIILFGFDFWNVISKIQAARQSDDEILLNQLWAPTFGYFEKLLCFYRAPITLFWLAAIYRSVAVCCSILLQWVAVCWALTFGCSEKHFCFLRAPIALFWLAAI